MSSKTEDVTMDDAAPADAPQQSRKKKGGNGGGNGGNGGNAEGDLLLWLHNVREGTERLAGALALCFAPDDEESAAADIMTVQIPSTAAQVPGARTVREMHHVRRWARHWPSWNRTMSQIRT